jgi:outer membrane protein OmpA-like peptidoglycan-associated protein/tetratricopeptide (TPR) repeat protein
MRKYLLALLAFLPLFVAAQPAYTTLQSTNKRSAKDYERGITMIELGSLEEAFKLMSRAAGADSIFVDAYFQMAAIRHDQGMLGESERWFEKALSLAPAYRKAGWLQLGLVEWKQDKFDEAEISFQQYLAQAPTNQRDIELAQNYLERCAFSANAMRNPVPFEPRKLGPGVNTNMDEYLPSFTADGGTLIFTRVTGFQEDFYLSRQTPDGDWEEARPIEWVNTSGNEGAQTVSADGRLLIFTACNRRDSKGRCDLYFTEYKNGKWTEVRNLGEPVNTGAWESQPSLSADGRALYFASDRRGGKGEKDLWVSYRQPNGGWGEPQNLGDSLNTAGDEQGPFIHPDGQTLYFMSDSHPGMGGADIFYSRLSPDGHWSAPVNIGYPINSKSDEGLLVVSIDGKTAYFASNRKDLNPGLSPEGKPTYDLYAFDLYPEARPKLVTYVKAVVRDAGTKAPLEAHVDFIDLGSGQTAVASSTDKQGQFLVVLPAGKNYALHVTRPQYFFFSEHFELKGVNSLEEPFLLEIDLQPIPVGMENLEKEKPIVLKNIFFESGSAVLLPESLAELDILYKLLADNTGLRIQINGHTDSVGTDADNLVLSGQRAKAVYTFLLEKGIEENRLRYKGFGETRPVDTNDTPEGRQRNRRTEFELF